MNMVKFKLAVNNSYGKVYHAYQGKKIIGTKMLSSGTSPRKNGYYVSGYNNITRKETNGKFKTKSQALRFLNKIKV